jgi:hypothetical protein
MSNVFRIFATVDRRVWYFLIFILVALPLLRPVGFPLKVGEEVKTSHSIIEALKPGDVVIVNYDIAAFGWDEIKGICYSVINHLFQKEGVKVIFMTDFEMGYLFVEKTIKKLGKLMEGYTDYPWYEVHGKKYLEDWIDIGFIPGRDKAIAALAADFRGIVGDTDWYGNPITEWLDEAGVYSPEDIDLVITLDCAGAQAWWVDYWYLPYKTRILNGMIGVSAPESIVAYDAGMLVGIIVSVRGAAEYQYLTGYRGMALVSMDAFSLVQLFLILVVIIGNIGYYGWERMEKRRGR